MNEPRDRLRYLISLDGIDQKQFRELTNYTLNQWHYWFGGSDKTGMPKFEQLIRICEIFDWNLNYIAWGDLPLRRSGVRQNLKVAPALSDIKEIRAAVGRIEERLDIGR